MSINIDRKMIWGKEKSKYWKMERMEKGLTWVAATRRSEPELTSGRSHLEDTGQNRSQLRETNVKDESLLTMYYLLDCNPLQWGCPAIHKFQSRGCMLDQGRKGGHCAKQASRHLCWINRLSVWVFEQLLQTKGSSGIGRGGGEDLFLMGHEGRKAKGLRVWGWVWCPMDN